MRRTPLILLLAGPLALCCGPASAKPKKPKAAPTAPPAAAAPAKPAEPAKPLIPTLANLIGAPDKDIKDRLGAPDMARREGQSAMWTYAWPDCALMVFLKSADGGRTLQVSGATAGPRRRGQPAPTVDACLARNHDKPARQDDSAIDALLASPQ